MATIREIAKKANTSIGTVSNYLNEPSLVAESTQKRIEEAIEYFDYHPKAAARSLKSRFTRRIGIVPLISYEDNRSDNPGDNAFLELLAGINTAAAENKYDILLSAATNHSDEMKTYQRLFGEGNVDGIILQGIQSEDERILFLKKKKFPFVAYGQSDLPIQYAYVDVDGAQGIIQAITYLKSLGHNRIAYITPSKSLMCTRQRWDGFIKGMDQNNLQINDEYVIEGDFSERSGYEITKVLLNLNDPPTAVLTSNDICAFGVIRCLTEMNLVPGKDVSVIGFDNISVSQHWQPGLTTIAQPFRKIGFLLMESLLNMIQGKEQFPHKLVQPDLIIRESTGPV